MCFLPIYHDNFIVQLTNSNLLTGIQMKISSFLFNYLFRKSWIPIYLKFEVWTLFKPIAFLKHSWSSWATNTMLLLLNTMKCVQQNLSSSLTWNIFRNETWNYSGSKRGNPKVSVFLEFFKEVVWNHFLSKREQICNLMSANSTE